MTHHKSHNSFRPVRPAGCQFLTTQLLDPAHGRLGLLSHLLHTHLVLLVMQRKFEPSNNLSRTE